MNARPISIDSEIIYRTLVFRKTRGPIQNLFDYIEDVEDTVKFILYNKSSSYNAFIRYADGSNSSLKI